MAPIRQSNVERRRLRDECREKLSQHISSRLGIRFAASQVRLNPTENDLYIWKVLPGMEEAYSSIFSKNLSDHSVSAYRELCKGVGVTFEAIPSKGVSKDGSNSTMLCSDTSFSSRIQHLVETNARLSQKLYTTREELIVESSHRQRFEDEVQELHKTEESLREEIRQHISAATSLQAQVLTCVQELNKVVPTLESLRRDLS